MTGMELIVAIGFGSMNLIITGFGIMIYRRLGKLEHEVQVFVVATEHRITTLEANQKTLFNRTK